VELVRGAEEAATQAGSSILLADTSRNPVAERRMLGVMDEQRVRGLITTTGRENDDLTRRMASRGTQCVLLTRAADGAHQRVHSVHLDDVAAGALAAKHLWALSRRRVAVLTSTLRLATQRLRLEGIRSAHQDMGPDAGPISVGTSSTADPAGVANLVSELLRAQGQRPDAIVCTSGRLTLGAVHALRTVGVRVPDDLALVTFDDFPWAPLVDPPLTVVDQRPYEMGIRATEVIPAEDRTDPEEIVIAPTLIVRRSCGVPAPPTRR
jgi:LacI family transcriptional regulator